MVNYIFLFGLITRAYTAQGTRQGGTCKSPHTKWRKTGSSLMLKVCGCVYTYTHVHKQRHTYIYIHLYIYMHTINKIHTGQELYLAFFPSER